MSKLVKAEASESACSRCGSYDPRGRWRLLIFKFHMEHAYFCERCDRRHRLYRAATITLLLLIGCVAIAGWAWLTFFGP